MTAPNIGQGFKDTMVTLIHDSDGKSGTVVLRQITGSKEPPTFVLHLGGREYTFEKGTVIYHENDAKVELCEKCNKYRPLRSYDEEKENHGLGYTSRTDQCDACMVKAAFSRESRVDDFYLNK
jgi:hypothetical protein